jgi:hypothetical protein
MTKLSCSAFGPKVYINSHNQAMGGFACPILGGPVLELENLEFIT